MFINGLDPEKDIIIKSREEESAAKMSMISPFLLIVIVPCLCGVVLGHDLASEHCDISSHAGDLSPHKPLIKISFHQSSNIEESSLPMTQLLIDDSHGA